MKEDPASAAEWKEGGGNSEEEAAFRVSDSTFYPEHLGQTTSSL